MTTKTSNSDPFSFFPLPWWAVGLVLVFLGLALFGERGVLRVLEASRHRDIMQGQILALETRNADLKKEIQALRSDKRYIEDMARQELGMMGDNEVIFVFPRSR
ncbi:MAG: septum formation initiator family protein [Deltaproteobacteria bacterium]|nr:septum formation initiator family protein [Deltaproteobacteria bacterium]